MAFAYESASIRAEDCTIPGDHSTVVVTFPYASGKPGFRPPFGREFLASRAISAIPVTVSWSHWFQIPEMDEAMAAVRDITRRFDRVVTYGQSMGGYGALIASKAVGANAILSLAPQYSLDRAKAPWETRWPEMHARILAHGGYQRDDMAALAATDADLFLAYDPHTIDAPHVAAAARHFRNVHPLAVPFCGHRLAEFLKEARLLSALATSVFAGDTFAWPSWRGQIRASRRTVTQWWANVASAAHRHPELVKEAVRRADALGADQRTLAIMARALLKAGLRTEALALLSRLAAENPSDAGTRLYLGKVLTRCGRYHLALAEFRATLDLTPHSADAELGIAECLARLADPEGARNAMAAAERLGAGDQPLRRVAEILARSDARPA